MSIFEPIDGMLKHPLPFREPQTGDMICFTTAHVDEDSGTIDFTSYECQIDSVIDNFGLLNEGKFKVVCKDKTKNVTLFKDSYYQTWYIIDSDYDISHSEENRVAKKSKIDTVVDTGVGVLTGSDVPSTSANIGSSGDCEWIPPSLNQYSDVIKFMCGLINSKCDEVKQYVDLLHNNIVLPGQITDQVIKHYALLPLNEKNKYLDGSPGELIYDKEDKKSKSLCVYYKNLLKPCLKKILHSNGKYTTVVGMRVHKAFYMQDLFRRKHINTVNSAIRIHALCYECSSVYGGSNEYFINLNVSTQQCVCCRVHNARGGSKASPLLCKECFGIKGTKVENLPRMFMQYLKIALPQFNIDFATNQKVNVSDKRIRFIDLSMQGYYKDIPFNCIIEIDDNQHKTRDQQDEHHKMSQQAKSKFMPGTTKNKQRMLLIRVCLDSEYIITTADNQHVKGKNYSTEERLVMLRQWILWWLLNIEDMRQVLVWYMWYDSNRKHIYLCHDYPGFAIITQAPPLTETGWGYLMEPREKDIGDLYENTMSNITFTWELSRETSTTRIPPVFISN